MASIKRLKQHQLPQYCNLVTEVLHKELSSHEVMSYQQIVHLQQAPVCTCSPAISNHLILQPERAFFWLAAHSAFTSSPFADKRSVLILIEPFIVHKLQTFILSPHTTATSTATHSTTANMPPKKDVPTAATTIVGYYNKETRLLAAAFVASVGPDKVRIPPAPTQLSTNSNTNR